MEDELKNLKNKMYINLAYTDLRDTVYIKVSAVEYEKYEKLLAEMYRLTNDNKGIPKESLDTISRLFVPLQKEVDKEYNDANEKWLKLIKEKFKEYDFVSSPQKLSFEYMIIYALEDAMITKILNDATKHDILFACYESMCMYRSLLNDECKKIVSHYMMTAMAGYITLLVGQEISKEFTPEILKSDPSIASIYRAIYKITDKVKCKDT